MRLGRKLALAAASSLTCLLLLELGLRVAAAPSERSWGTLLGQELPPVELIPHRSAPRETDRDADYRDLVVDGRRIATGDLWGFLREDPRLGYAPRENTTSRNGWWQSNNIGARRRQDTQAERPAGRRRLLVFGDSFAQGSRVQQEQAWPALVEQETPGLEVVNLAVDGYSTGQSYLRYLGLKDRIDHDLVLLTFVPVRDLWRDVNTLRTLAEDWDLYLILPRFVVEQGRLRLVPSPYETGAEVFAENAAAPSARLEDHLQRYDRFYFAIEHEEPWLVGRSVLHKLLVRAWLELHKRPILYSHLEPDSEAVQVTRKIFESMNDDVRRDGKTFVLLLLPSERDLAELERGSTYRRNWDALVASTCGRALPCIDLADDLLGTPRKALDSGYDGTHYGPEANRRIAELVQRGLAAQGFVGSGAAFSRRAPPSQDRPRDVADHPQQDPHPRHGIP